MWIFQAIRNRIDFLSSHKRYNSVWHISVRELLVTCFSWCLKGVEWELGKIWVSRNIRILQPRHPNPFLTHLEQVFKPFSEPFILFQIQIVCRRQFQMWWQWQKAPRMDRKHCGKRRNCSLRAISPFPTVFSKDLYCKHAKTRACLGKG